MITAFLLGLMGSLHCAGMCGPLVLMTPVAGNTRRSFMTSRLVYHAGRISTYGFLGIISGLIGESIAFAGFQRWLSISAGFLMIISLVAMAPLKARVTRLPVAVKARFSRLLRERTYSAIFALGATNGLLPCGLVYMAATASIAMGGLLQSVTSMILFGVGTLPVLLAISIAGKCFNFVRIPVFQKLAPAVVVLTAALLIARSEPLGLLKIGSARIQCPACVK